MYRVYPLGAKKELVAETAKLAYDYWFTNRDIALPIVELEYDRRSDASSLPLTIVALCGEELAGMISLKQSELSKWLYLGPWISALYVKEGHRKRGVGGKLLSAACHRAHHMGFRKIYLFTDHRDRRNLEKFYSKRGWNFFESTEDDDGMETDIFFRNLF